ncbi:DUF3644 domain-containing protein [Phaeobacter sp. JH18-5]
MIQIKAEVGMVARKPEGALTNEEKRLVKALLAEGERNQDIQALINIGRSATINSARITEVKQDDTVSPSSEEEVQFFRERQKHHDPITGLNLYSDERLIRAREAMILAVQVFNSPALMFKSEVFSVLANIAWTYLLHEHYKRKGEDIVVDGRSLLLSQMIAREDAPLSQGMKDNLQAIKEIRDQVEHLLLRRADLKFLSIFQACCLNFDKVLCDLFGEEKTLKNELTFSLQFAKVGFDQVTQLQEFDVPPGIEAIDKKLEEELGDDRLSDLEYRFRVVYTFENSTKSKSHIKFVHPTDEVAEDVKNVLIKKEISDKLYPHKPSVAAKKISEKSGRQFTPHNHTQAWRKFDVRPKAGVAQPENTNADYCVYHSAHKDYTYSDKWVQFVSDYIADEQNLAELCSYKL